MGALLLSHLLNNNDDHLLPSLASCSFIITAPKVVVGSCCLVLFLWYPTNNEAGSLQGLHMFISHDSNVVNLWTYKGFLGPSESKNSWFYPSIRERGIRR